MSHHARHHHHPHHHHRGVHRDPVEQHLRNFSLTVARIVGSAVGAAAVAFALCWVVCRATRLRWTWALVLMPIPVCIAALAAPVRLAVSAEPSSGRSSPRVRLLQLNAATSCTAVGCVVVHVPSADRCRFFWPPFGDGAS